MGQELKNHQALEQECDTLKRKKKMKENELQKLADKELKKTKGDPGKTITLETKDNAKPASENEEQIQSTSSAIRRGVPKKTKPAPAVVAVKMADLLALPKDQDTNADNSANSEFPTQDQDCRGNDTADFSEQKQLEKQTQEEQLRLQKEMKQKEKLKKEEEAKAKKDLEKLDKLRKKEEAKLEKKKKEEETRAKKQKELEEKAKKLEQQKLEKQKKEVELKAKKEQESRDRQQKQEQGKFEKLEKEQIKKEKELDTKQRDKHAKLENSKPGNGECDHLNKDTSELDNALDLPNEGDSKVHEESTENKGDQSGKLTMAPTESVIKRGVPKNTKTPPAVVAIKMADLLKPSESDMEISAQVKNENVDTSKGEQVPAKESQAESAKFEKVQQEKLKREEDEKYKKEQQRLAKLWQEQQKQEKLKRKEHEKQEKLKKDEEAKAKKEKALEEKRQKHEREKIEKVKKEEEKQKQLEEIKAKAKKEKALEEKRQDQENMQRGNDLKANEQKQLGKEEHNDEQQIDDLHFDDKISIGEDVKQDNASETKVKPTESVIKRGVPKNRKPAPAVVAIKMADLLSANDDEVDQDQDNIATRDVSSPDQIENEVDDVKSNELLEKQKKDEKLKLEMELKQQEKLKREEEAKAKKEQERLAKLQKKEAEKLEKLKKEEEAKAKKEKALEEKRLKQEKETIEKQQKEEEKLKQLEETKAKKEAEKPRGDDSKVKESEELAEVEPND